ncbi:NADH dehydrogenase [ubiquinone] 1 alpha subcomplex subunit 12-like [Anarrhichthys ocellatus]|uniref:NADH dehydrogenase [ubiquinone] 1 alpha subcomplex subunit 12-like n=1 Tax=Anarrhichthys ocellatus TaxID=433405 RepID=UPI0012ED7EA9|nr:NADH dehydrogenase [ubiquinone] 1 alpha subcomplex subunit 12-like [Anarrhichthys ocellatus]
MGRHRWVIFTTEMNGKNTMWQMDGSMPKMNKMKELACHLSQLPLCSLFRHRWLHCMTDDPPTTHPPEPKKFLAEVHQFNVSGSSQRYVPFPTTSKKIHEWVPPKVSSVNSDCIFVNDVLNKISIQTFMMGVAVLTINLLDNGSVPHRKIFFIRKLL